MDQSPTHEDAAPAAELRELSAAPVAEEPPAEPPNGETTAPSADEADQPLIPLEPGQMQRLLAALIDRFPDITGTHLRRVLSTAISGPNRLDFLFPVSYDLGRKACESSEVVYQIEHALKSLVGVPVQVRFLLSGDEPTASGLPTGTTPVPAATTGRAAVPTRPAPSRTQRVEETTDALANEVMRVFGVTTWVAHKLAPTTPTVDADTEGADSAAEASEDEPTTNEPD